MASSPPASSGQALILLHAIPNNSPCHPEADAANRFNLRRPLHLRPTASSFGAPTFHHRRLPSSPTASLDQISSATSSSLILRPPTPASIAISESNYTTDGINSTYNTSSNVYSGNQPQVNYEDYEKEKKHANASQRVEEIVQANNIIQSLNSFSSVAHICGMGLKVIPAISAFSSLRTVNLSGNSIVHITPGSLPKNLHTLDLPRNKIATIEGLQDLTRLRVLNLSYNRISSIGRGLSSCTLNKELYLSGNKISDIEGLHRLLKLTVLDLSFNKITTAKALGQLVANYSSLLALNLLGNPIQSNIGDESLILCRARGS